MHKICIKNALICYKMQEICQNMPGNMQKYVIKYAGNMLKYAEIHQIICRNMPGNMQNNMQEIC